MSKESQNIFGNRLKLARKMAGMSLQDLSDALINKVSKQALSKYETGLMNPTSEVLLAIAKALNIKPDYFLKEQQINLGNILFRKKTSLSKKDEDSIVEKARDYIERYVEIENILMIENTFKNPLKDLKITDKRNVEFAANQLREIWEIGNDPIPNIIETLEFKGVKVMLIDDVDDVDGFAAFTSNGIPVVVINTRGKSIERIRFTIIHELAHLLLIFDASKYFTDKEIEVLCHCFSSCFLIPTKMLVKMIGDGKRTYIAIKELISIKEYFGISIRALVHRLRDLEIITPNYYQRWVIYMSKTYGHKEEPGNYKGEEKSRLFEQYINRALSEELISLSKAASLSNLSINQIRKGDAVVKGR